MDEFLSKNYSSFAKIMDTIAFLVVVNFLAILGTIVGLGFFGIYPSIFTTYQLVKKRLNHEDFRTVSTFIEIYKKSFFEANKIGIVLVTLWIVVLLSWFYYLDDLSSWFHIVGMVIIGFILIILVFVTMLIPISYVYFPKFKIREHLHMTILLTFGIPLLSMTILFNVMFFYGIVMIRLISVFPFLAFSLPAYLNMIFARKRILKFFKIYEDEHVSIRILNSYAKPDDIYHVWQKYYEEQLPANMSYFQSLLASEEEINQRLSAVVLDQKEELVGFMLAKYIDTDGLIIKWMYIEPSYQKRGYAKKYLEWLYFQAVENDISEIYIEKDEQLFMIEKDKLQLNFSFFRKQGFKSDSQGKYSLIKHVDRGERK
jgi:uncharacterized membrane protein YesL/N-acetylglutamate synthase-like GNAT family acetyltransferase